MCVCVHGYTCFCISMCTCMHMQNAWVNIFFSNSPLYSLRQGLPLNLELTVWLDWLANEFQGSTCVCLPSARIMDIECLISLNFLVGSGKLNLDLHVCTVSTLPTDPFPQFTLQMFCFIVESSKIAPYDCSWITLSFLNVPTIIFNSFDGFHDLI